MRWILFLAFTCAVFQSDAQRFSASVIAGFNASQIDGDMLAGFDKLGIVGGLRGTAIIGDRFDLNVEFLYSQKGSRRDIFSPTIDPEITIKLQYIDLPVYLSYGDWYEEEGDYYKITAHGGLAFGRLISASIVDDYHSDGVDLESLVDEFNANDISFMLGFGIRTSVHWMFSFRYTRSINLLLDADKKDLIAPDLRPYFLSFRVEYIL
jgi:hypothetical protein